MPAGLASRHAEPVLRLTAEGEAMRSRGARGARMLAVAALAIALAAPASAATDDLVAACPSSTYEQPFAPWLDFASYVLAPNGALESGGPRWGPGGGGGGVAGNESYYSHRGR